MKEERKNQEPFSRLKSRAKMFIEEKPRKILSLQLLFIQKRRFDQSIS
jgi:hypothetical protein